MIKKSMAFTTVLAAIVAIFLCANTAYAQDRPGWRLVWNDEFDGTSLDTTKWDHEVDCWGGGNNELQCYTARPQNSYVRDGKLTLVAVPGQYSGTIGDCTNNNDNSCGNTKPYTSARLRTRKAPLVLGNTEEWK
jgi:beta-glucanase (GH16 family)